MTLVARAMQQPLHHHHHYFLLVRVRPTFDWYYTTDRQVAAASYKADNFPTNGLSLGEGQEYKRLSIRKKYQRSYHLLLVYHISLLCYSIQP